MIEELLAYQAADAGLKKIENELSASEDRKKAVAAKKYLDGVEESVNKLDARAARLAEEFSKLEEELAKCKEQESEFIKAGEGVEDGAEAAYLLKKIDEASAEIKILMQKAEKLTAEINAAVKEYVRIKSETKAAQAQYAESGKKYSGLKASFKEERERIEGELKELAKKVDPALMERYLKKRAGKIYPVLFEARGQFCGACNMELPMSELGKLKNGEIIECDQCGRLLYQKPKSK